MRGDTSYVLLVILYPIAYTVALILWPEVMLWVFLAGIPVAGIAVFAAARSESGSRDSTSRAIAWFRLVLVLTTFAWPYAFAIASRSLRTRLRKR